MNAKLAMTSLALTGVLALAVSQAQTAPTATPPAPVAAPVKAHDMPAPDQLEPAVSTSPAGLEPPAATSAAPAAVPAASAAPSAPTAAAGAKPRRSTAGRTPAPDARGADRMELESTEITGNRELPKVMYIVPWKRSDLGDLVGKPVNSLLDEVLEPLDRDVFRRENRYFEGLKAGADPGKPDAAPGSGGGP